MGNRRSCCLCQKNGYGRDHNLWSIIASMSKTQNPLLSRKMEEKWPKTINTEVLDMGGSCTPNEQMNQISGRSRPSSRPFTPQFGLKKGRARPPGPLPLIHLCKWDLRAHNFKAPFQDNSLSKWGSLSTFLHLQTHIYHWNVILTTTTIIIILIVVNVVSLLWVIRIVFIVGRIRTAISGTLEMFPILRGSIKHAQRSGANKAHNTSEFKHTLHNHFSWSIFRYSYCLYKWGKKCNHFI